MWLLDWFAIVIEAFKNRESVEFGNVLVYWLVQRENAAFYTLKCGNGGHELGAAGYPHCGI